MVQFSEIIMKTTRKKDSFAQKTGIMGKKTARANNNFLLGSLVLIVLVMVTVVIFLFWAFRLDLKKENSYSGRYEIVLDGSTSGTPLSVYVNDSLLFSGTPGARLTLSVNRFAQESSLLVVDGATDRVTVHELPEESARVTVSRKDDGFAFNTQSR